MRITKIVVVDAAIWMIGDGDLQPLFDDLGLSFLLPVSADIVTSAEGVAWIPIGHLVTVVAGNLFLITVGEYLRASEIS